MVGKDKGKEIEERMEENKVRKRRRRKKKKRNKEIKNKKGKEKKGENGKSEINKVKALTGNDRPCETIAAIEAHTVAASGPINLDLAGIRLEALRRILAVQQRQSYHGWE